MSNVELSELMKRVSALPSLIYSDSQHLFTIIGVVVEHGEFGVVDACTSGAIMMMRMMRIVVEIKVAERGQSAV